MDQCCGQSNGRVGRVLAVCGCALLGINLLVMITTSRGPSSADAQVRSYANAERPAEASGAQNEPSGPPPGVPGSSIEMLRRIADGISDTNQRLGRIEAKLDSEMRVRVTDMPAPKTAK